LIRMFSDNAINYFSSLRPPPLPGDVEVMNPYVDPDKAHIVKKFYQKFYNDNNSRLFIFGINPGRFGGGLTGISFTDPVALKNYCGIENNLGSKRELSSEFIYMMIEEYGGTEKFFGNCYLSALFPFALLKGGNNYNFYDDNKTFQNLYPYLKESVKEQGMFGSRKDKVISLGMKNAKILEKINNELKLFHSIEVLEHPRFIMQYRRKYLKEYIFKYVEKLK
jgi:hypothetical protein